MNGIEKEIDNLGRVVIPIEFRKKLGVDAFSKVSISLADDNVIITPIDKRCALCGKTIKSNGKFKLCNNCILQIRSEQ